MGNLYIGGSDNLAHVMKAGWIGDQNGKARKIKNIYVGDQNGLARQVWSDSSIYSYVAVLHDNRDNYENSPHGITIFKRNGTHFEQTMKDFSSLCMYGMGAMSQDHKVYTAIEGNGAFVIYKMQNNTYVEYKKYTYDKSSYDDTQLYGDATLLRDCYSYTHSKTGVSKDGKQCWVMLSCSMDLKYTNRFIVIIYDITGSIPRYITSFSFTDDNMSYIYSSGVSSDLSVFIISVVTWSSGYDRYNNNMFVKNSDGTYARYDMQKYYISGNSNIKINSDGTKAIMTYVESTSLDAQKVVEYKFYNIDKNNGSIEKINSYEIYGSYYGNYGSGFTYEDVPYIFKSGNRSYNGEENVSLVIFDSQGNTVNTIVLPEDNRYVNPGACALDMKNQLIFCCSNGYFKVYDFGCNLLYSANLECQTMYKIII